MQRFMGRPGLCPQRTVQLSEISDWRCFLCPCHRGSTYPAQWDLHGALCPFSQNFWGLAASLPLFTGASSARSLPSSPCCEHQKVQEDLLSWFPSPSPGFFLNSGKLAAVHTPLCISHRYAEWRLCFVYMLGKIDTLLSVSD